MPVRLDQIPDVNVPTRGIRLSDIPEPNTAPIITPEQAEIRAGEVFDLAIKNETTISEASKTFGQRAKDWGKEFSDQFIGIAEQGMSSWSKGWSDVAIDADKVARYIQSKFPDLPYDPEFLQNAAEMYDNSADYWKKRVDERGLVAVGEFLGELGAVPAGVTEFVTFPPPVAGVLGAAEAEETGNNEVIGFLAGAMQRYALGKIFKVLSPYKATVKVPAMATLGGVQAAVAGGETPEIIKGAGTFAVLSMGGNGEVGLRDFRKNPPKIEKKIEAKLPAEPTVTAKPVMDVKSLTDKALVELGKAERPRDIIEVEKTKELGRRVAISAQRAEKATGEQRLRAALSPLKGELTEYKNPDFKPLRETMTPKEIDALHEDVWTRPWSEDHFDKIDTAKAWAKVVEGFIPTRGEILMLEKQWGKEFAKGLLKKLPLGDKIWDAASDVSNFMRTLTAGGDVSVAGRQLRVLGQLYPEEYGEAVVAGLKSYRPFKGEALSKEVRKEYESSEFHKEAKKYVKFFEPAGTLAVEPSERPEWYVSHYPEKIPILGNLIRMGNRNYVETMNMFTEAVWDKLRIQDKINGIEPSKQQLVDRGKWLMSMEGRPEIGGIVGRRIAPITAGFFFAPRYAISRFTTPLYLRKLVSGDPEARAIGQKTAGAFAALIGTNIAILTLAKLKYGDEFTVELDPRSAEWGKGRIGSLRIDLWAGYQQAARFLVQMVTGEYKTSAGKIKERPRTEVVGSFVRSKENPLVSLIADLWAGKTYEGDKPFSVPKGETGKKLDELGVPDIVQGLGKEAYNRMLFMWVQDFIDASINDGWPTGLTAGTLSWYGVSTQSYPDTAYTKLIKFKDEISQREYKKNWEDLNPSEQKRLGKTNKLDIANLELQTKIEGVRRDDYDYVARLIEDEKKVGKNIYNKLQPQNQKALDELGISLGLTRKIDDWVLNDERYQKYQELTTEILDEKLSNLTQRENWKDLSVKSRTNKITLAIESAKEKARNKTKKEAKQE